MGPESKTEGTMVLSNSNAGKAARNNNKQKPRHVREDHSHQVASFADKPGLEVRAAATKILSAVLEKRTSLDGMLDNEHGNAAYMALSPADRGLLRAIINSALRHLPRIDAALDYLLDSPLPQGAKSLHHIFVVAIAQMVYLDIPDHSAVDLAVEQAARDPRTKRFVKLVNAILRRLGREKDEVRAHMDSVPVIPAWYFKRLVKDYDEATAQRISDAQLTPSGIDVTVKANAAHWAELLNGKLLPNGGIRLENFEGAVSDLPGYEAGEWWVQDFAAVLPVLLMGDLTDQVVIDACAAPGGKTAQLVNAGAKVIALEQSANRLKRLNQNMARLGFDIDVVETNMMKYQPEELVDAVLLDAPCSSTGTIRKHPDVLWTKGVSDIEKLASVQDAMLRHALTMVKSGGYVVFSNCSADKLEGEQLVERLLAERKDLRRMPFDRQAWPQLAEAISDLGDLRTTADMFGGIDGFYAARIQKL
jgi:16S rRNA (cytosine967-C5)-methyltransferase